MVRVGRPRAKWLYLLLLAAVLCGCAGKRGTPDGSEAQETDERLFFVANVQGNPLCLLASIQKMRVFPWLTSPRTRWRVHTWLVVPGAATSLFTEAGKRKPPPSVPLTWTEDTLMFTTDQDRFVYFQPFPDDKLLLLTDAIFPERVRKSGEEDVHYTLLPASLTWNSQEVPGRLFYQKQERAEPLDRKGFPSSTGMRSGGRAYAIWVPGGVFLYLEQQAGDAGGGRSSLALMEDRRGRWQETFDVSLSEPEGFGGDGYATTGAPSDLHVEVPFWRMQGTLHIVPTEGPDMEAAGEAGEAPDSSAGGDRLLWTSLDALADRNPDPSVRFCLLKGSLDLDGETHSVYGVGIMEP